MHLVPKYFLISSFILFAHSARAEGDAIYTMAPAPSCASEDPNCLVIEQDHGSQLSEFGKIEFVGIVEDSRCPVDVFCFWEGQVKVELMRSTLSGSEKFVIGLGSDLENEYTDSVSGQKLVLDQVWPERNMSHPIEKPYQVKVRLVDPKVSADVL